MHEKGIRKEEGDVSHDHQRLEPSGRIEPKNQPCRDEEGGEIVHAEIGRSQHRPG